MFEKPNNFLPFLLYLNAIKSSGFSHFVTSNYNSPGLINLFSLGVAQHA